MVAQGSEAARDVSGHLDLNKKTLHTLVTKRDSKVRGPCVGGQGVAAGVWLGRKGGKFGTSLLAEAAVGDI